MTDSLRIDYSYGAKDLDQIRALRYEILRKPHGMPESSTHFPEDDENGTLHLLVQRNGELIGCATLLFNEPHSIQLRGMAVATVHQGTGIGRGIVSEAMAIAVHQSKSLWCNARLSAIGFYARQAWIESGDYFDTPVIGKHIVMTTLSGEALRSTPDYPRRSIQDQSRS